MRILYFAAAATVLSLATAHAGLNGRGDFDVLGLERDYADFGSGYVFEGSEPEVFIEALPGLEKNESLPELRDRSAELVGRQSCDAGYGYCSGEPA
jgi:hypothetical protein